MGPSGVSNNKSPEITPDEIEANASLIEAPPRLESRASDGPPAPLPPAVKSLVDKHTTPLALPKKDWCGRAGSEWAPEGMGKVDWSDACKTHDECYATPGATKLLCDYSLQQDMSLACAAQGGGFLCELSAGVFFRAVRTEGGDEAFERAQAAARYRP